MSSYIRKFIYFPTDETMKDEKLRTEIWLHETFKVVSIYDTRTQVISLIPQSNSSSIAEKAIR